MATSWDYEHHVDLEDLLLLRQQKYSLKQALSCPQGMIRLSHRTAPPRSEGLPRPPIPANAPSRPPARVPIPYLAEAL